MQTGLIFFDIEGTLTGINGRGHSPQLSPSLRRLMYNATVGLLTGRESSYACAVNRLFDLNGPIIAENGCELIPDFKNDETVLINYGGLTQEQKLWVVTELETHGIFASMYTDPKKQYMVTLYMKEFPNHRLEQIVEQHRKVQAILAGKNELEVSHSSAAVDINPRGVNKRSALLRYCREQGIPLNRVGFVGDSLNDLSAFEAVGNGRGKIAIVGDSTDLKRRLKQFNPYCSQQIGSEGTVEFIDYLLKAQP